MSLHRGDYIRLADKFQQKICDALIHRWLFWPVFGLVVIDLVLALWWVLR